MLENSINNRFESLLKIGKQLKSTIDKDYWLRNSYLNEGYKWLSATANLIAILTNQRGIYWQEAKAVMSNPNLENGIPTDCILRMNGTLESAFEDWRDGFLSEIEYIVAASTFDDFLDHAKVYHKGNKKIESSVLISAVLEDTIKKIARKYSINSSRSLEPIIDDLIANNVFTSVRGKRVKGYTSLRNKALHAQWDEFDIKDVGETISGLESIIADYLLK